MKRMPGGPIAAAFAGLALAACNDSGFILKSEGSTVGSAEGVYSGTLTNGPGGATDFLTVVLEDGSFWTLYGQAGSAFAASGFGSGSGTSDGGTFSSSQGTEFGAGAPAAFALEGTYDAALGTLQGSFTSGSTVTDFTGGAISNGTYTYAAAPNLQLLPGTWNLPGTDGDTWGLTVATDGTFTMTAAGSGCTGSGAITARPSGKNVFNVSVQFANVAGCGDPGGSATGIALAYPITGSSNVQLVATVKDGATWGLALAGTLP